MNSFTNLYFILQYSETVMLEAVNIVANRLQEYSKETRHKVSQKDLPPFQPKHFTSVVIIHHKKSHSRKEEIEFIANIQHKGKINPTKQLDDVGVAQTVKDFSEVFTKFNGTNDFPTAVLIEGAPGIGKTTLCKEIMFQWSSQNLLQCKKIMFSVFLRDPIAQCLQSLQDFVGYCCKFTEKINSIIEEYISFTAGKDIVVILDGYDELPENIRNNSGLFLVKLINQNCVELLKCTVVITSRLSVSAELHGIVDRRVEIMGFTENNRKEYIMQALENDSENVEKLLKYLEKNPTINAYCYIPLNMTILLSLFTEGRKEAVELPTTQTEINKTFIYVTISRSIKKTQKEPLDCSIANFEDIPAKYNKNFYELCQLAYNALHDDKIVFSKNEVQKFCKHLACSNDWSGLGLLKAVEFFNAKDGVNVSLNFLHLSLQETLAAYHITLLPKNRQINLLKETSLNTRYFNTRIMYVGLTKGQSFAFKHFLSGNRLQVSTLFSLWLYKSAGISDELIGNKVLCLHLFQCFSEAENDDMCRYVGSLLRDGEIDLSGQTLSAVNIHTLGLFLGRSSIKQWKLLNLSNCYLGMQEIEQLCTFCSTVHIDHLNVSYNNLTQSSTDMLTKMFFTCKVKQVIMHSEDDNRKQYNIINHSIRQYSAHIMVPLQTKIFVTDGSILVICKYSYTDIIAILLSENYLSIHLFSCQLGSTSNDRVSVALRLSESSKNIYLYNCETSFIDVLETVMISEVTFFHFMEENNTSFREIRCAVEEIAQFSITLGEDVLPLHVCNMTERPFQEVEEFVQSTTHGSFVFRQYCYQDIQKILSYFHLRKNVSHFIFRKCFYSFKSPVIVVQSLQHQKLFCCVLQNQDLCNIVTVSKLLQHVILSGNSISNKGAKILADGISDMTKLQHLELERCNLHEDGLISICNAINNRKLQTLTLNHNIITDKVANELAQIISRNSCIEVLHLSRCSLQYNGIKAILLELAKLKCLKVFDVSHNKINDQGLNLSTVIAANTHLEQLDLSYCEFKANDIIEMFKENTVNIKSFNFSGNHITETATGSMIQRFSNSTSLQNLSLSNCYMCETTLVEILKNVKHSLKHLDLSFNVITDKAAKSVADVIHKNTDLEHLNLTNCYVQENGLYLILKSLRTACNLKFIDLKSNPMNNNLAGELADYISNNHLLNHLSLSNCALQEEGFLKIADALKKMNVLIYFDISSNNITSEVGNKLIDVFGENSKLKHLDISECQWNISMILCTNMTSLKCLNCSGCKMDDEQAAYLSCLITINTNLEQLTLVNCALKPAGLLKVFNALKEFCTVSYLDISNNQMTPKVIEELAEVIHWKQIEHLGMSHCLQGENSSVVLTAIANSVTLQYLDLSYNDISDHEGNLVASAIIANNNLHHINLANNKFTTNGIKIILNATASIDLIHHSNIDSYSITDELTRDLEAVTVSNSGLESIALDEYVIQDIKEPLSACISKLVVNKLCVNKHIADNENMDLTDNFKGNSMLKNNEVFVVCEIVNTTATLVQINLSHTNISDQSAEILVSGIKKNCGIQHLELASCSLHEEGLKLIIDVIKDRNIRTLNLSYNSISDYIACELASVIMTKHCIEILQMKRCRLKHTGIQKIIAALKKINSLQNLNLSYNKMAGITPNITAVFAANIHLKILDFSHCELHKLIIKSNTSNIKVLNVNGNNINSLTDINFICKSVCLHTLCLSNCISSQIVSFEVLAMVKNSLKHLDLSFNVITDKSAKSVADVIHNNPDLEHLNLSNCKLQEKGLTLILRAAKNASHLKYINLEANRVNDVLTGEISSLFSNNKSLSYVSLCKCMKQEAGFLNIADSLVNTNLIHLEISFNIITNSTATILACSISFHQSKLKHLNISNCDWQENSFQIILKAIMIVNSLRTINVGGCEMGDEEIKYLATSITANNALEQLMLTKCAIRSRGLVSVFEALKKLCTLNHLDLSYNQIDKEIMYLLAEVVSHNQIEHLNLSHCSLEANCSVVLTAIADSFKLQYLDLSHNTISGDITNCVALVITANEYLKHVNLTNNHFNSESLQIILKAMATISSLHHINLGSYIITGEMTDNLVAVATSNPGLETVLILKSKRF